MKPSMFNCKQVSVKISESLDGPLPFHQRLMIRFHVLMCAYCANFRRQLMLISKAGRYENSSGKSEPKLSERAHEQISQALKNKA